MNISLSKEKLIFGAAVVLAIIFGALNYALPVIYVLAALVFCVIGFFIFKNPFWGVLLVAFFLPFERIGAYEFGDTTIRLSQVFFIITTLAWFINILLKKEFKLAKNPAFLAWILFLLVGLVTLPGVLNLSRSLTVFAFLFFTSALAWVIPNLVISREQLEKLVKVLLLSFIIVSLFGLWQFGADMIGLPTTVTGLRELYTKDVLGFTRVQSTAYEPLYFANYLLIPLMVVLALFLSGKTLFKAGWWIALFALGVVNLILTVSRGGYLAVAVAVIVVSLFFLRRVLTVRNLLMVIVAAALLFWVVTKALGIGGEFFTIDKFTEHISNAFYGASYDERVETFSQATQAWREHPFFGLGPGGFGPYVASHPAYVPKDGWKIVNNEFIEILAENGLVGLFVFIIFIIIIIARSVRAIIVSPKNYSRTIMVALLAAFIGIIVQYQTFSTLYIMHVWFLVGLMIAVQNIIFQEVKKEASLKPATQPILASGKSIEI